MGLIDSKENFREKQRNLHIKKLLMILYRKDQYALNNVICIGKQFNTDNIINSDSSKEITTLIVNCNECNLNDNEYEQIMKINAKYVIIAYDAIGWSGSIHFHKFINNLHGLNSKRFSYMKNNETEYDNNYKSNYILARTFYEIYIDEPINPKKYSEYEYKKIVGKVDFCKIPDLSRINIFSLKLETIVLLVNILENDLLISF